MSNNCFFKYKSDIDCDYDDEEEEEKNEEEEESKEELNEMSIINEDSNILYSDAGSEQNDSGKDKQIKNKVISLSQNLINQSSQSNILSNSKNSKFLIKIDNNNNDIIESYSNKDECNILLNNIIDKDKISNSIIITEKEDLMIHILDKIIHFNISRNKKICFIINDIKRAEFIENNLNGKNYIKTLFLQKIKVGKNKTDYQNCRAQVDINNLFIIKQDILYKLLSIGYIKISDFGVIIFDECHLCEGNHHYNLIMQEFYFYYISNHINISLPNIIGFTNSNFKDKAITKSKNKEKNKIKVEDILKNLSENLNSQIIIDPNIFKNDIICKFEGKVENIKVESFLRERTKVEAIIIILVKYFFEDMINLSIKDYIKFNGENDEIKGEKKIEIKKRYLNNIKDKFFSENLEQYTNIENSEKNIHLFSKNSYLFKAFENMQRYLINIIQNADLEEIYIFFENYKIFYEKNLENLKKGEEYMGKIYKKMIFIFKICMHAFKRLIDKKVEYESDRINKFKEILNKIYNKKENNKILIFVPNRKIAYILNSYLNRDKKNNKFKNKSKYIVGANHKKEENTLLTLRIRTTDFEIKGRIKEYIEGKINILICTPPTLEYLSNLKCDIILMFGELSNTNNFYEKIKSKAILCNSKIIALSSNTEKILNDEKINDKNELKNFLMKDEKIRNCVDLREENFIKNRNDKIKYYYIRETEAKISMRNCAMLFNEIKNMFISKGVEIIDNAIIKKCDDEGQKFRCILKINCQEYNQFNLQLISGLYNDKQSAGNECYMQYLISMHQKRIIDNNLQLLM